MPPCIQPKTLEYISLQCLVKFLDVIFFGKHVMPELAEEVTDYFNVTLPPQLVQKLCLLYQEVYGKELCKKQLNTKYLKSLIKFRSTKLNANKYLELIPDIEKISGKCVECFSYVATRRRHSASFLHPTGCGHSFSFCSPEARSARVQWFVSTFCNLRTFHAIQLCNDDLLLTVLRNCRLLEEISVSLSTAITDSSLLCFDTYTNCISRSDASTKHIGQHLKKVVMQYTLVSADGAARMLHHCPNLEFMDVMPDVNVGDIFMTLYGSDTDSYQSVNKRYKLKSIHSGYEIEENVFALICRICPALEDVILRCNGVERVDKNLLANLIALPIKKLKIMNCSSAAMVWYLERRGSCLTHLHIIHLISAIHRLSFSRTCLQQIVRLCPNLTHFTLQLSGGTIITPDVPYDSFGTDLLYFTSLTNLVLEAVALFPDDLIIFISKCKNLEELQLISQGSEILDDSFIHRLISTGCLKRIHSLTLYRPMLTTAGLKEIIAECPSLEYIGPLSSWAIPEKDIVALSKEIKEKNWKLSISPLELDP